ncbi:hypothetical protein B0H10DRAFT_1902276 [Mycena sp. CBHHK59/15]|nr:hypothetical protein B0H10DRAFT_1902276 [Mycena sp. CBHHK59/15]
MSSPFIYSPDSEYFPHFNQPSGYFGSYFGNPPNSPFIPGETVYPSSPYVGPTLSDPGSPNTPIRSFFSGLNSDWNEPHRHRHRRRRPSWHGRSSPTISPFIPPPVLPPSDDHNGRRNPWSWGTPAGVASWLPSSYQPPPFSASFTPGFAQYHRTQPQPIALQIHPWLNGDSPSPEFFFDLSVTAFAPKRLVGPNQAVDISIMDIHEPAFHPPVTKLRIVCDMIPNWPIDLVFNPYQSGRLGMMGLGAIQAPPITLGDILISIHQKMHQRISHLDWGRLSMSEEAAVSRSFTQRCRKEAVRNEGSYSSDFELPERLQGVKVVDFLFGKTMFRGLVRAEDGSVRMLVG